MAGISSKTLLLLSAAFAAAAPAAAAELPPRVNPAFAAYVSSPTVAARSFTALAAAPAPAPRRALGHIPSPVEYSRLAGRDFSRAISGRTTVSGVTPPVSFSATYDLRSLGRVTAIRDQGSYGDCWSFATLASMESWLMPGESRDFSESNIAKNSGFDGSPMVDGGNSSMSSAYMVRWSGPVNETDDPHDAVVRGGLTVQKHSQEVRWIPPPASVNESAFKSNMKSAIENYGAVYSSLYWDDSESNNNFTNFYNDRCTKPYGVSGAVCTCGDGTNCGGHAIALVGWNDNYSASNFASAPPGPGAYIARNSWGTGVGESGYFYISYYDSSLGGDNAVFKSAEAVTNYINIYQYDTLGYTYDLGNSDYLGGPESTTEWMANIFTATDNGNIKAAGFYTTDANTTYTMYVYTGVSAGSPRSGTLAYSASGSFTLPGFYTVPVAAEVTALAGERFSIVVKLTNPSYIYPIAVEKPYASYSSGATASAGQSYFSNNGSSWTDLTSLWANTNACLKAYQDADSTPPTQVATVNDGTGADISKTGSSTQLSANWTASSDPESDISGYYYTIGTSSGAINIVNWTSNGTSLAVTHTGLALTAGTTYYFGVKARNGVGTYSAPTWSNGQFVDNSAPEDIPFVYDGTDLDIDYTATVSSLAARWGASSFPSGSITRYEYAIGTTPGGAETAGWTNAGLVYSVIRTGLALAEGTTYYFAVKAYNDLGNPSAAAISDGQVPDITAPSARVLLASAQPAAAGALSGKLVLTETADRFPQAPTLSFRTSTGRVVPVTLSFLTASTWTISGYVETFHSTGTASFIFSATDAAGNAGASITSGGSFTVNTAVSGSAGGYVSNSDGGAVLLPAGTYSGNVLVSIATAPASSLADADGASPDSVKVERSDLAREFTAMTTDYAQLTTFPSPVTITMSYPDADNDGRIDMDLLPESSAWIFYLDASAGRWVPLPGVRRDTASNTLSVEVSHFSIYSVRSTGSSDRGMSALKAYPNPCDFRNSSALVIAGLPVDAAGAKIYIYNTAGELVRTLSSGDGISALNVASWDGRDNRGGRAASGLYIYLVRTSNYGKERGKFFIIW